MESSNASSCSASGSTPASPYRESRSPSPDMDAPFVPASPEVVTAYEELMTARLPHIEPVPLLLAATPAAPEDAADDDAAAEAALGRPLTKSEKQNAKKKRRKERERLMRAAADAARAAAVPAAPPPQDETVAFRLFSSTPVRAYTLSDRETYPVTPNPRLQPLPPQRAARIRATAAAAATSITPALYAGPAPHGLESYYTYLGSGKKAPKSLPPLFASEAATRCRAAPRLETYSVDADEEPRRNRRRRRPPYHPPPRLWRAEEGVGGKSAGYGYGFGVL